MQFIRQIYDDLPETIVTPTSLRHLKAEVIILPLESKTLQPDSGIASFFGAIPDFPERAIQEDMNPRAELI